MRTDATNPIAANQAAGVEFATASVSSPGLESYLSLNTQDPQAVAQIEQVITLLIDDLTYNNLVDQGYLTVTFTAEQAQAQWHYINTVKDSNYQVLSTRSKQLSVNAGSRQLIS